MLIFSPALDRPLPHHVGLREGEWARKTIDRDTSHRPCVEPCWEMTRLGEIRKDTVIIPPNGAISRLCDAACTTACC